MLIFMQVVSAGFFLCFHQWGLLYKAMACFHKTTACFLQNDVLFCIKRRVVFFKVTCCFHQNDVLFFFVRSNVKKHQSDTQSISQDFEM